MIARRTRRLLGYFLALAWLASPAGLTAARTCPHHDGTAGAHAAETHGEAHHRHQTHDQASHARDAGEVPAGDSCNCMGACALGDTVALLWASAPASDVPLAGSVATSSASTAGPRDQRIPHFLPYSNAPPQTSITG